MQSYEEILEQAIEQYIGLPVLNRIKADPARALDLNQELIDATMFFMDVRSFTQFTGKIPANNLIAGLNNYLGKMSGIIIRHHGFIDSIIGDAIFAVFGITGGQHADDACNAALECLNALEAFNKRPGSLFPFNVGIGINSGTVTLGNIGSGHKLKFTVIGSMVNMASRMGSLTGQYNCSIILSEHTKKLLTKDFNTKELDKVPVKGLDCQVVIYSLQV